MVSSKHLTLIPAALSLLLVSPLSLSKQWIPESKDEVVLNYTPKSDNSAQEIQNKPLSSESIQALLNSITSKIEQSQLPGNSYLLSQASQSIDNLSEMGLNLSQEQQAQLILAKANLAQQSHDFQQSIELLHQLSGSSLYAAQALLIKSRLFLIQGEYAKADNACRKLISLNIKAGELCILEVKVYQQEAGLSQSLAVLGQRYNKNEGKLSRYFNLVLATHFLTQEDYIKAEEAFSYDLLNAPSSQWYQWADMALQNQRPEQVYRAITSVMKGIPDSSTLEDGFIVRLARAEKLMGSPNPTFQNQARQLVELRQKRNDRLHAADIAYYFIYVSPDPAMALKWAKLNWEQVKEPSDKNILLQAQKMNKK